MLFVASSILAAALASPRAQPPPVMAVPPPPLVAGGQILACDDGVTGGTLVQPDDAAYGNRFELVCAAARLRTVTFEHFGAGLAGPYAYRLRLLDADCRPLAGTALLSAPDAAAAPATAEVDVAALGWCIGTGFVLALEPLTCTAPGDCFPALAFDASSDGDASAHCGVVVAFGPGEPACFAPRSTDGRYFDFRLRAGVECDDPGCTTAVTARTWSGLKRLYSDPSGPP